MINSLAPPSLTTHPYLDRRSITFLPISFSLSEMTMFLHQRQKKNSHNQPTERLTAPAEDLTVSPTRLKTIASMRDTLGQLEAEFTIPNH